MITGHLNIYTNMVTSDKKRLTYSCDNSIIVSNGQQKPHVMSPRQPFNEVHCSCIQLLLNFAVICKNFALCC